MSDVKWIKLSVNVFDDEKFDAIKTLPDSNDMQLVWVKLLCLAGKCNESGFLMISREIPYTDEMLAQRFNMDVGVVQRALSLFQSLDMMEVIDNIYMVSNWSKYQTLDSYEKAKERDKLRKRAERAKKKALLEEQENVSVDMSVDSPKTVHGFCSISISNNNNINNIDNLKDIDTIKNIINYLNNICNTRYRYNTESTKKKIKARLKEGFTEDDFKQVIDTKYAEWGNNPQMSQYLRPETLFGTKFESYLNQNRTPEQKSEPKQGEIQWQ